MSPLDNDLNVTDVKVLHFKFKLHHFYSNLFFPQHLTDAKKAQQNLESSFKHLESVSHMLLLLLADFYFEFNYCYLTQIIEIHSHFPLVVSNQADSFFYHH